jgi:hypothetical protein
MEERKGWCPECLEPESGGLLLKKKRSRCGQEWILDHLRDFYDDLKHTAKS